MRYKSKRQLLETWQQKINSQKYYFKKTRKKEKFEDSEIYKNLQRRKDRAVYRYENRDRISEQRKQKRIEKSELRERAGEMIGEQSAAFSGPAVSAFKGRQGTAELDFAKRIAPKKFVGHLFVEYTETGEIIDKIYYSISGYFEALARIIKSMFSKSSGYAILESEVIKKQTYDPEKNALYYEHLITVNTQ